MAYLYLVTGSEDRPIAIFTNARRACRRAISYVGGSPALLADMTKEVRSTGYDGVDVHGRETRSADVTRFIANK
jgi:hypothetical protein